MLWVVESGVKLYMLRRLILRKLSSSDGDVY